MKRYLLTLVMMMGWQLMAFAAVSVEINPSSVQLGEMFRLTLTLDNPKENGVPDLTPLKQNFNIVGTERTMSYNLVNGQMHSMNQWVILLTAKKTGSLAIPPIRIGLQQSTLKNVLVRSAQTVSSVDDQQEEDATASQEEILLKTELSQPEVFVNQQVIYKVKLLNRQRLMNAEYTPPHVENALLIPLGDARTYQTSIHGKQYAVEEQQYAIFPQKSGPLTIAPPSFSALVFDTIPTQVHVEGKAVKVHVKSIPTHHSGKDWLPAKKVSLTETFEQLNTTLDQGSTLVRTVTLQATGLPAQMFPTLNFSDHTQFNAYPEKPELKNSAHAKDIVGRMEVKVTYLFNKPGQITIPAMHVSWFNVETNQEEVVHLPAHVMTILATHEVNTANLYDTSEASTKTEKTSAVTIHSYSWLWGVLLGFCIAWFFMLVFWLLKKINQPKQNTKHHVLKQLKKACIQNHPKKAQEALLQWASYQWPENSVLNLQQLSKLIAEKGFKTQITILSEVLYGHDRSKAWQGEALWQCVSAYKKKVSRGSKLKKSGLPPMNPK